MLKIIRNFFIFIFASILVAIVTAYVYSNYFYNIGQSDEETVESYDVRIHHDTGFTTTLSRESIEDFDEIECSTMGNYTCQGIFLDQAYTIPLTDDTILEDDMDFYLKYTENSNITTSQTTTYSVRVYNQSDQIIYTAYYESGDTITPISSEDLPHMEGFEFSHFDSELPTVMGDESINLYAIYTEIVTLNDYDLIFRDGETILSSYTITEGDSLGHISYPDTSSFGNSFIGWTRSIPQSMPSNDIIISTMYADYPKTLLLENPYKDVNDIYTNDTTVSFIIGNEDEQPIIRIYDSHTLTLLYNITLDETLYKKYLIDYPYYVEVVSHYLIYVDFGEDDSTLNILDLNNTNSCRKISLGDVGFFRSDEKSYFRVIDDDRIMFYNYNQGENLSIIKLSDPYYRLDHNFGDSFLYFADPFYIIDEYVYITSTSEDFEHPVYYKGEVFRWNFTSDTVELVLESDVAMANHVGKRIMNFGDYVLMTIEGTGEYSGDNGIYIHKLSDPNYERIIMNSSELERYPSFKSFRVVGSKLFVPYLGYIHVYDLEDEDFFQVIGDTEIDYLNYAVRYYLYENYYVYSTRNKLNLWMDTSIYIYDLDNLSEEPLLIQSSQIDYEDLLLIDDWLFVPSRDNSFYRKYDLSNLENPHVDYYQTTHEDYLEKINRNYVLTFDDYIAFGLEDVIYGLEGIYYYKIN